ncbi:hypothetical protein DPMN_154101 [Dreissena polymorpha]|uniref:Uncharacterized protein n=1 Tax=Dreissena polymorpha TaxID=45954 RepID=A0A9D4FKC9_DREPO|nr:hypothetical protein DPMN_154101 [Dreissena polymorpha]
MTQIGERMKQAANETAQAEYERDEAEQRPKTTCTHTEVEHEIKKIDKHIHDGRLVKLSPAYVEHVKDCLSDPGSIEKGGYGTVYICELFIQISNSLEKVHLLSATYCIP